MALSKKMVYFWSNKLVSISMLSLYGADEIRNMTYGSVARSHQNRRNPVREAQMAGRRIMMAVV